MRNWIIVFCLLATGLGNILKAQESVARMWNEVLLEAIRDDLARPTVHARNLFHTSTVMYDAWAAYDTVATTYLLGKTVNGFSCPYEGIPMPADITAAQEEAISYAAYRLLSFRFANSPGGFISQFRFDLLMQQLGYDIFNTSTDYALGSPAALGNYIAQNMIEYGLQDGSNEQLGFANQSYAAVNDPLVVEQAGNPNITDFNRWQPLTLEIFIDQSGNVIPGSTPDFLSPEWGIVAPFALQEEDLTVYERDGFEYWVYHDPGAPPYLDIVDGGGLSDEYKWNFALVSVWGAQLTSDDGVMWDISPGSIGNIDLPTYPTDIPGLQDFYNLLEGGDPGTGYDINPHTGLPYEPQMVPRGDYARVLAEFWADGPDSETPPGHWFTILNAVNDHPELEKRFRGQTEEMSDLEWDIKTYFALGGAMHDAAITAWGIKGWYDFIRPISAIRGMADLGQSSDPNLPSFHVGGIPLIEGYIELVETGDPLAGVNDEHVGKIKLYSWKGPNYIEDEDEDVAGVDWILAENWWPYQRPSFVTPPFAGYVSGHSTYSRAAAEVLTAITGDPFFPGGMGEFPVVAGEFLVFEDGPSVDFTLQWATYRDASDQCSLSRIWGGIHPPTDDIPGRLAGIDIGLDAINTAERYFYKDEDEDGYFSYEDCDDNNNTVYPGAPELCDGLDNNCNGDTDEGVLISFFADTDEDGFGDADLMVMACSAPDGYVADSSDCNDNSNVQFPGQIWYADADLDGYSSGEMLVACLRPTDFYLAEELQALDGDCNDNLASIYPGAPEICDELDNNCDGNTDEGVQLSFYADSDGDGYGDVNALQLACSAPDTFVANADDCNDDNADEFPGQLWYADLDGDRYSTGTTTEACLQPAGYRIAADLLGAETDCDDDNADIFPGATEVPDNGLDEDCSGSDLFEQTRIFPNPMDDFLTVHFAYEGEVQVFLFNALGQHVNTEKMDMVDHQLQIPVNQLAAGVYILELRDLEGKDLLTAQVLKR